MIELQYIIVVFYSSSIYYRSLLHYGKFKKKSGENKNKLRTIYPRNQEYFKKAGVGSDLTGSYKKRVYRCEVQEKRRFNYFSEIFYSFFYKSKSPGFGKKIKNKLRTKPGLLSCRR